ncbi:MAG: glycosyltransferase family 9 protein [Sedimentisphaerales bacterium]|nr:glycosyltransferase family 9 protein [Sedimentisphaerales bacterium]
MNPTHYRDIFNTLKPKNLDATRLDQLARQVAYSFIDHCYFDDHVEPAYIDLLCDLATQMPDEQFNRIGAAALFGVVIERLCDDYEDFCFDTYNRVMTQILSYCRRLPEGEKLDVLLRRFRLHNARDIAQRAEQVHSRKYTWDTSIELDRIVVLSRITIGADVAITSVIVQRLQDMYPQAEILLVGPEKLSQLFADSPNTRILPLNYTRRGGLVERFGVWHDVLEMLSSYAAGESAQRTLLIDPDSRITQLGLLPLSTADNYLYFDSHRDFYAAMAELTNEWLDDVFGPGDFRYPAIWPDARHRQSARDIIGRLRHHGCRHVVTVNLGVGGNTLKALGLPFEEKLIQALLSQPNTVVILDKGFGPEEALQAKSLQQAAGVHNHSTLEVQFGVWPEKLIKHGLLIVNCTIGEMAALIGQADEFIGYDSACQHIAAAQAKPTITVFAGTNHPRFVRRWRACGPATTKIVHVDAAGRENPNDLAGVVERVMQERTQGAF